MTLSAKPMLRFIIVKQVSGEFFLQHPLQKICI